MTKSTNAVVVSAEALVLKMVITFVVVVVWASDLFAILPLLSYALAVVMY